MKYNALPPLGWFRVFESAARLLSFTAAADELGLTQSAVSQQIRALEDRMGCPLFIRKHRAIALTDDGRRLLPGISEGIANLRAAAAAFEPAADPKLLTIATSVSVAQWFLAPLLQHFIAQNPSVKIRIITAVWPDEFVASAADVRIRYCPIDAAGKQASALGSNQIGLFAATETCAEDGRNVAINSMDDCVLIQPVGTSDTWIRYAEFAGLSSTKQVSMFVDSHGLAADFAQSGTGVALTSSLISAPGVINGKLKLLHPLLMPAKDGYFIETPNGVVDEITQHFTAWIKQECLQAELNAYGVS